MEELFEVGMLLDFYGQLITKRQYEILDLHYNNDYSLAEIAEHLNISRQGVYDNIKRGKALLNEYEKKLGLVKRFTEQRQKAISILEIINGIDASAMDSGERERLKAVKEGLQDIIEGL